MGFKKNKKKDKKKNKKTKEEEDIFKLESVIRKQIDWENNNAHKNEYKEESVNEEEFKVNYKEKSDKNIKEKRKSKIKSNKRYKPSKKELKAQKEQEEFKRYKREQERLNEKNRLIRERREKLEKLSSFYYQEMKEIYNEKINVIAWIENVKPIFEKWLEHFQTIEEKNKDLKYYIDKIWVGNYNESYSKSEKKLNSLITNIEQLLSPIYLEANQCKAHLREYNENFSKPTKFKSSNEKKMERRFNDYLIQAEIIQDMQVELKSVLQLFWREYITIKKKVEQFISIANSSQILKSNRKDISDDKINLIKQSIKFINNLISSTPTVQKIPDTIVNNISEERTQMIRNRTQILRKGQPINSINKEKMNYQDQNKEIQNKNRINVKSLRQFALSRVIIHQKNYPHFNIKTGKVNT